jgi:nucleotide-binding universal stress UspA family protein
LPRTEQVDFLSAGYFASSTRGKLQRRFLHSPAAIRTALRLDIAPEDGILRQARLGSYDLAVMGVGRLSGAALYFGKITAAVLENSQHSMLFVSS